MAKLIPDVWSNVVPDNISKLKVIENGWVEFISLINWICFCMKVYTLYFEKITYKIYHVESNLHT